MTRMRAIMVWAAATVLTGTASAQTDYHNLNRERPLLTEDATPLETGALEFALAWRYQDAARQRDRLQLGPEIGYGLFSNLEVSAAIPVTLGADRSARDREQAAIGALFGAATQGRLLPALALRAEVELPRDGVETGYALTGILSRSWGRTRLHLNVTNTFTGKAAWHGSAAVDYTFYRQSLLLLAEVSAEEHLPGAPSRTAVGVGMRYQWTPLIVLDAGVRRQVGGGASGGSAAVGVSYLFPLPLRGGAR